MTMTGKWVASASGVMLVLCILVRVVSSKQLHVVSKGAHVL